MAPEPIRQYYSTDTPELTTKEQQRRLIEKQVAAFLDGGGKVTKHGIRIGDVEKKKGRDQHRKDLSNQTFTISQAKKKRRRK